MLQVLGYNRMTPYGTVNIFRYRPPNAIPHLVSFPSQSTFLRRNEALEHGLVPFFVLMATEA